MTTNLELVPSKVGRPRELVEIAGVRCHGPHTEGIAEPGGLDEVSGIGIERRIEQAKLSYERAVYVGDVGELGQAERELDKVEADLVLARGRILHARFLNDRREDPRELALFERATHLYRMLGDSTGEAELVLYPPDCCRAARVRPRLTVLPTS
ncbi:hypothetical protein [Nonomuraea turcica]|uniref:hypothetical protein n=1 Tax=Nonomuraea sp. G32 TaxID=3067274 RepID=UPI00273BE627|nr:hypothetical protein [Nonomuraea sp. G32]MDP4509020.1 hypothetical protein [Nonomuraea sp. G32]